MTAEISFIIFAKRRSVVTRECQQGGKMSGGNMSQFKDLEGLHIRSDLHREKKIATLICEKDISNFYAGYDSNLATGSVRYI